MPLLTELRDKATSIYKHCAPNGAKGRHEQQVTMVENDFTALAQKVVEQWRNENVPLNTGATEDELLSFEKRFALTLPPDFRYFYSLVNGMTEFESDKYFFYLWPLEEIAAVMERNKALLELLDEETKENGERMGCLGILGEGGGNSICSAISRVFRVFPVNQKEPSSTESVRQPSSFCKIEIPFGGYLIDSHRYFLCQDKKKRFFVHSQVNVGERLADNFGHFLQLYLSEPDKLYL